MQISMSGTISRALPKDQTGTGMGLVAMLNFLTGSVATSVYGKIADLGATVSWNPLNADPAAFVYGNLYLALALTHLGLLVFYRHRFGISASVPGKQDR
jgi:DHA2 family metal-tetracycline-proton antiporter-like MFS transporter